MQKPSAPKMPKSGPFHFFREVATELKKVTWPTRTQTAQNTVMVLIISVLVGAFIGGMDLVLLRITSVAFGGN